MDLLSVRMELPAPHAPQRSRSQDRLRPPGCRQIPRSQMCRPPLPSRFRRRCRQLHPPHPQTGHPRLQAQRRSRTLPPGNRARISQPTKNPGPSQSRRRRLPPPRPRRPDLENIHVGTAASAVRSTQARRWGAPSLSRSLRQGGEFDSGRLLRRANTSLKTPAKTTPTPQSPSPAKHKRNQTPPHATGHISPTPHHAPPDSNSFSTSTYDDPSAPPAFSPHTSPAPNTSPGYH